MARVRAAPRVVTSHAAANGSARPTRAPRIWRRAPGAGILRQVVAKGAQQGDVLCAKAAPPVEDAPAVRPPPRATLSSAASGGADDPVVLSDNTDSEEEAETLQSIAGHGAWVTGMDFHPAGTLLAPGSYDCTITDFNRQTSRARTN